MACGAGGVFKASMLRVTAPATRRPARLRLAGIIWSGKSLGVSAWIQPSSRAESRIAAWSHGGTSDTSGTSVEESINVHSPLKSSRAFLNFFRGGCRTAWVFGRFALHPHLDPDSFLPRGSPY